MFGFSKSKPQVLIVGAGPVGLFAALTLARRGIRVEVVEEEWRGTTRSYALALHPRSLELLDELELSRPLLDEAQKLESFGFYDEATRRAGLDLTKLSSRFPFVAILPQSSLEQLLLGALAKAGVDVHYNHRLASIEPGPRSVSVRIDELGKDSVGYAVAGTETVIERSRERDFPLVIAADGHDSLARRQLRIAFDAVRLPQHFAVFEFEASGSMPQEACVTLGQTTTDVLWPLRDGRFRWSFSLSEAAASWDSRTKDRLLVEIGRRGFPHLDHPMLEQLIGERARWFEGKVGAIEWSIQVRFEHRLANEFGAGRVWLAGDAAHMASPVGMQSMNVGLREAHELCDTFAQVLDGSQSLEALRRYGGVWTQQWLTLLGSRNPPTTQPDTDPWVAERAERLISCLPASGPELDALLNQLRLRPCASAA